MKKDNLVTKEPNTWCPGCLNNTVELALKLALADLIKQKKLKKKNIVLVTDIGCSSKIYDYLNLNAYYSLHGRALPAMLGIKLANPELTVIGIAGDGGTYNEGIAHLIHNARYNADINLFVTNNQVFALTTGQETATSEQGYPGPSTPGGVPDVPLNPIKIVLAAGGTFVARGCPLAVDQLVKLMKEAILHKGFSFMDILQPCITFHNSIPFLQRHIYQLSDKKKITDLNQAWQLANEWNYNYDPQSRIALGIFYQEKRKTFTESWLTTTRPAYKIRRNYNWRRIS